MTECKEIYPKPGSISKPGFQCDTNGKDHEGNHQETFVAEPLGTESISMTLVWSQE